MLGAVLANRGFPEKAIMVWQQALQPLGRSWLGVAICFSACVSVSLAIARDCYYMPSQFLLIYCRMGRSWKSPFASLLAVWRAPLKLSKH